MAAVVIVTHPTKNLAVPQSSLTEDACGRIENGYKDNDAEISSAHIQKVSDERLLETMLAHEAKITLASNCQNSAMPFAQQEEHTGKPGPSPVEAFDHSRRREAV